MGLTRRLGHLSLPVVIAGAAAFALAGCGPSAPQTAPLPARKVTWDEYQKLAPDQKTDPHISENLDDEARKKLAESQRKKR